MMPFGKPITPVREFFARMGTFGCDGASYMRGHVQHGGPMNESWMAHGNCVGRSPDIFFPHDGVGVEIARKFCQECSVQEACLAYALCQRIKHGVWGGRSERQRRLLLRQAAA